MPDFLEDSPLNNAEKPEDRDYQAREKAEEQKKEQEKESIDSPEFLQNPELEGPETPDFATKEGYGADHELGFDFVDHDQGVGDERDLSGKKRKLGKLKALLSFLAHVANISALSSPADEGKLRSEKTRKDAEYISSYRHHTILAPGDQAGVFDDEVAAQERASKVGLFAVLLKGISEIFGQLAHELSAMLKQSVQQGMNEAYKGMQDGLKQGIQQGVNQAIAPYSQQIQAAQQLAGASQELAGRMESGLSMDSGVTMTDGKGNSLEGGNGLYRNSQGANVSNGALGTLSPPSYASMVEASRGAGDNRGR